jgi:enoyl-CoA hydratase
MEAIHQGYDLPLADALQLEALLFAQSAATKDKREGVAAFLEKRTAKFVGE